MREGDVEKLRAVVRDCLGKHLYSSAIFFADKLATMAGNATQDLYMQAQALYLGKQYRRALHLLRKHHLVTTDLRFRYLAGKCLEEVKEWDECLLMLGESEVDEEGNVLMLDDQDTELLDKDAEEREINIGAAICLLRGRAFEALENRARALRWYKAALKADPYCYEAFEHLIDHHMLTSEEEAVLLNSLKFDSEDRWLSLLYSCRTKKYGQIPVIEEKFQELEKEPDESRPERTVKVRRSGSVPASEASPVVAAPTFNFKPSSDKEVAKPDDTKEEKEEKEVKEDKKEDAPARAPFDFTTASASSPFAFTTSLSWMNTPSASTTSSTSTTSVGTTPSSIFGVNTIKGDFASFSVPVSLPADAATEGAAAPIETPRKPIIELNSDVPVTSGEEGEHVAFQTRAKLFILETQEGGGKGWKERGKGVFKVNVADDMSYARLVMRVEGSLRLILNVRLWDGLIVDKAGDKAVRFTAPNFEQNNELASYLVRVGTSDAEKELIEAVRANKSLANQKKDATETSTKEETTGNNEEKK